MDGLRDNFRAFLLRLNRLTRNDQVVLSILAVVIGAVTAVGAIGFRELIHFLHRVLFGAGPDSLGATAAGLAWWQVLLVPTLGGLAIGLFVRYVLPGGRPLGVAQVIEATAYHGGRMPFLAGLGGKAKSTVWALNVYSLSTAETCAQIEYISKLPGQQEPGVLLELGNELYSAAQGMPQYPNSTVYAEAMIPIVACARRLMPKAKVGACGLSEFGWNVGVRAPRPRAPSSPRPSS